MSTSNMPARIWADLNSPAWSRSLDPVSGFDSAVPYYRADIVERMAEALAGLVEVNEHHNKSISEVIGSPVRWKDDYLDASRAALTSYREASNDHVA